MCPRAKVGLTPMRILILCLFGIAVTAALYFAREAPQTRPARLTLAVAKQPMSGLIYIAYEEGYFQAEGLDVKLIPYVHGKRAVEDILSGKVDMATAADLPFTAALKAGLPLNTIATIGSSDKQNLIIARRDKGIERPRDLIQKRVGVVAGTSSEVFLDAFLVAHLIRSSAVERVFIKPEDIEPSIRSGHVDAVSTWALPGQALAASLKDKSMTFAEEGLYIPNWFLLTAKANPTQRHAAYVKLLRALLRAEEFEAAHPAIAQRHVARHLSLDPGILAKNWGSYYFNVGLHQYVLTNLETHARLLMNSDSPADIDFAAAMFFSPLMEIDPNRVTVIH